MKNSCIFYVSLSCVLFFTACKKSKSTPDENHNSNAFHSEMDAAMMKMKNNMDTVTMTMDNDLDFAKMMIPHHQGSIDMSNIVLKYGNDASLLDMANKFKTGDQESINHLNQFISSHGIPTMSSDHQIFMGKIDSVMMKMHETMMAYKKSSDPDYDFAQTMIHHHQGAIDMADLELHHGSHTDAKSEAQEIIDHQQADIIKLAKFINEHGEPK